MPKNEEGLWRYICLEQVAAPKFEQAAVGANSDENVGNALVDWTHNLTVRVLFETKAGEVSVPAEEVVANANNCGPEKRRAYETACQELQPWKPPYETETLKAIPKREKLVLAQSPATKIRRSCLFVSRMPTTLTT